LIVWFQPVLDWVARRERLGDRQAGDYYPLESCRFSSVPLEIRQLIRAMSLVMGIIVSVGSGSVRLDQTLFDSRTAADPGPAGRQVAALRRLRTRS
jgi:hypothetical protein